MKKQEKADRCNDAKFWDLTGSLLNKVAFQTSIDNDLTEQEINMELNDIDDTFKNKNIKEIDITEQYNDIEPQEKYNLETDSKKISDLIKRTGNIKPFIKKSSEVTAEPITMIASIMQ